MIKQKHIALVSFTIILYLCITGTYSCSNKSNAGVISIPSSLKHIDITTSKEDNLVTIGEAKKIFVLISGSCTACYSDFFNWDKLVDANTELFKEIPIYFIIYGKSFNVPERVLRKASFSRFTFLRDETNSFIKENRLQPDFIFNSFLVDEHNKIIIPGNPTRSEEILKQYIALLKPNT